MPNNVKHGKRYYKQMSLEVAVRNPERYEDFLKTFAKFENVKLDDKGILDIFVQLYLDNVVTSDRIQDDDLNESYLRSWIKQNLSHNNEWGYPTGYQAAFTRYLKTLSEFGFIYAQYNQPLLISPIAKAVLKNKISLSESFALQSMRFWRKSPYRRVLNDFNFFEFIIDVIIRLKEKNKKLSYNQFLVALFSDDGNVEDFIHLIEKNKIGDSQDKAYNLVSTLYSQIDSDHARVVKQSSAFNDYGNTVFRVLQLTGFISIDYSGVILISTNESRINLYKQLKSKNFRLPALVEDDELEYFKTLGYFDDDLENIIQSNRPKQDYSNKDYNIKLSKIVSSFELNKEKVEQSLVAVSRGDSRHRDAFWFIQAPVKFEFLLTIYAYLHFGDKFIYKPNYICDETGIPYSHAPGNIGDIEIYNNTLYWLIEATLIRSKNQQINSETVNLFRHIDKSFDNDKFLTLIAPYIHEDTKLIFNVAAVITMINNQSFRLNSDVQNTEDFISEIKSEAYFDSIKAKTNNFITFLKQSLNSWNSKKA